MNISRLVGDNFLSPENLDKLSYYIVIREDQIVIEASRKNIREKKGLQKTPISQSLVYNDDFLEAINKLIYFCWLTIKTNGFSTEARRVTGLDNESGLHWRWNRKVTNKNHLNNIFGCSLSTGQLSGRTTVIYKGSPFSTFEEKTVVEEDYDRLIKLDINKIFEELFKL